MIDRKKLYVESVTNHKKDKELDSLLVKRIDPELLQPKQKEIRNETTDKLRDSNYMINKMIQGLDLNPVKTLDIINKFYQSSVSENIDQNEHLKFLDELLVKSTNFNDNLLNFFNTLSKVWSKISYKKEDERLSVI